MSTNMLISSLSQSIYGSDTKTTSPASNLYDGTVGTVWEANSITSPNAWFGQAFPYPMCPTSMVVRRGATNGLTYVYVDYSDDPNFTTYENLSYYTTTSGVDTPIALGMPSKRYLYMRCRTYNSGTGTSVDKFEVYSNKMDYIVIQDGVDDANSPIKVFNNLTTDGIPTVTTLYAKDGTTPLTFNHPDYVEQILKYGMIVIDGTYGISPRYNDNLRRLLSPQHKIRIYTPDTVSTSRTITLTTSTRTATPLTPVYRMNYTLPAPAQTAPSDLTLTVLPKDVFIRPRYLRSMDSYTGVNKVLATYTSSGMGKVYFLCTYDQTVYYTFKNGWKPCVRYQDIVPDIWDGTQWVATTEDGVAAFVIANGMNPAELAAITRSSWDSLLLGRSSYGFGIVESLSAVTDTIALDKIEATVDTKTWYRIYDIEKEGMLASTVNATTAAQWKEVFKRTDLDFWFTGDPTTDTVSKLSFSVPQNTAPKAVNLTLSPSTIHAGVATIKADLIDDEGQNCEYRILLDGKEIKTWTGFKEYVPLLYDIQVASLTPGNHIVKLVTRDEGGAESQYSLNLTVVNFAPTANVVWNSKRVVASFGDPDGDVISYQLKINGNVVVPYTTYKINPFLDYRFKPGDLSRETMNIIRIDYVDGTGTSGFWEQQIIGSYFNVTFQDDSGAYYSDDNGQVVKILNMGEIMGGEESAIYKVYIKNETGYPIQNVEILSNQPFQPDMAVQFSHADSPFTPVEILTFPNIIAEGDRAYFFVRVASQESVPSGGEFQIKVRCEVVV